MAGIDWLCLVYALLVLILEAVQCSFGQTLFYMAVDSAFLILLLFVVFLSGLSSAFVFAIFVYAVLETYCFYYTGGTINPQFITHFDPVWAMNEHISFLFEGLGVTALLALATCAPRSFCFRGKLDSRLQAVVLVFAMTLVGFFFASKVKDGLSPFGADTFYNSENFETNKIKHYFDAPLKVRLRDKRKPRKNVVMILGESLEQQVLGEFNKKGFTKSMPFLTELANNGTFCPDLLQTPHTQWTVAAMFSTYCGMPLVVSSDTIEGNHARLLKNQSSFKCLGDIVTSVGYQCVCIIPGGTEFGGVRPLLAGHGFSEIHDKRKGVHTDWHLVERFRILLPRLLNESRTLGKPFVLMVQPEDTHPRYTIDHCTPREDFSGPERGMKAFDCLDQKIETLYRIMRENGMNKHNAELLIHGDHTLMTSFQGFAAGTRFARRLFAVFPFHEKKRIEKQIMHFDLVPTILERLGIDYEPKFPFGRDVHDPVASRPPSQNSYQYIFAKFGLSA